MWWSSHLIRCDCLCCVMSRDAMRCHVMCAHVMCPAMVTMCVRSGSVTMWWSKVLFCTTKYSVLQSTTLYYKVLLCTTKYYSSTTPYYNVLLQYYSSTAPVLLCTTKYYSSTTLYYTVLQRTTLYYNVLLQYYSILLQYYPVLFSTTKYYSSTTLYYKVLLQYYSVLHSTTTYYSVLHSTTTYYSSTTLYYKVLLQYYSVLQSTTPVLLCTTTCYSSTTLYYNVLLQYYSVLQSTTPYHRITYETSFTMRGATGVTIQLQQILRPPRKLNLMINPRHIWNVIYNERNNRTHNPTSPNTAPATQNESHHWSASHMKRHLQCAEQVKSPSNLTKYCACHEKWISWLIRVAYETSSETLFTMRGATLVTVQHQQILRLPRNSEFKMSAENPLNCFRQYKDDSTMIPR